MAVEVAWFGAGVLAALVTLVPIVYLRAMPGMLRRALEAERGRLVEDLAERLAAVVAAERAEAVLRERLARGFNAGPQRPRALSVVDTNAG